MYATERYIQLLVLFLLGAFIHGNESIVCNGQPCQSYMVCPGTSVEVLCNTTGPSSTPGIIYWKLPPGSCPQMNDTVSTVVASNQNCQNNNGTCGPYTAVNVPNWSAGDGFSCSSKVTVPGNINATFQCSGDGRNFTNITIIRKPLTLDAVSANETAITLTWTAPSDCCIVSYSMNNISKTSLVIPGSQQGYSFPGLKSNTLYSITLASFSNSCNVSTNIYTLAPPPQYVNVSIIKGSNIRASSINITWNAVLGVRQYTVYEGSPHTLEFLTRNALCTVKICAHLINLYTDPSDKNFTVCVSSLNDAGQNGTAKCEPIYKSGPSSASPSSTTVPSYLMMLIASLYFIFNPAFCRVTCVV